MTSRPRSSRRLAVVMFTDVVDSTAQRQRLGETLAEEVRLVVDALQVELAEANGGSLVKHLGDGLMMSFASASGALSCAVGIQSELRRASTRLPESVGLRIGIAAGDVAVDDGDLFGMPVVQAARLCDASSSGGVLVADLVRELTGRDSAFELADPSPLRLKGLEDEVTAWSLLWEHDEPAAVVPAELALDDNFVFVGRGSEWEQLERAWRHAGSSEPHIATVHGEAGVGKTRLVAEFAAWVGRGGGLVLYGRNDPDSTEPYQPFAEALRDYASTQPEWALKRRLGRSRGELVRLLPELDRLVDDLPDPISADAETERYQMFEAVVRWLSEVSTLAPVMLVIDDLHWASASTQQLLRHVAASHETMSLLVVVTYRDDEPDAVPRLPIQPHRSHDVALGSFDTGTVLDFLEAAAGHSLDGVGPPLAAAIHAQSGGNAFFCRELALHLVDQGTLTQTDGRWRLTVGMDEIGVPDSLTRVVDERLGRVSDRAAELLRWAAVLGAEVDLRVLPTVLGQTESDTLAALDECGQARLLTDDGSGSFRFHHALLRSSIAESIDDDERTAMHRRVADALLAVRRTGATVQIGELARHYELGVDDERLDQAVDLCCEAAAQAMNQLAYENAADFYRRALLLLDRSPTDDLLRRSDVMIELVTASNRAGDIEAADIAERAADVAEQSGDPARVARALMASSRGAPTASGTVEAERVRRLEATLDRLPADDDPIRARLLSVLASELQFTGEVSRVVELCDQALAMARRLGDRETRIFVLVERLGAIRLPDYLDAQLADVVELGRLSRLEGDRQAEFFASYRACDIQLVVNDLAAHDEAVKNTVRLAEELGQPSHRVRAIRVAQERTWLQGDLADASREQDRFIELARELNQERSFIIVYHGASAKVAAARGDFDAAVESFGFLASLPRGTDGFRAGYAVSLLLAGRDVEARSIYEELIAKGVANVALDITRTHTLCFIASLCASFRDVDRAHVIDEQLEPFSDLWANSGANSYGPVQHFRARLAAIAGRFDEADELFADAAKRCDRMEAPLIAAWNDVAWAEFLVERGDLDRARSVADSAATVAASKGANGIEGAAFEVLERIDAIAARPTARD